MRDAKRNQRSLVITLLDLKNAFGEINHKLIIAALQYHHVPSEITNLIENIYTNCQISIATGTQNTPLINVSKGLLQGDPCSPLIFNICFNPLMKLISQPKYEQLGYFWGPNARVRSWLQFADDTALISKNVKAAQSLIDLNIAWCRWTGMEIRTDKCISFGMRKQDGVYEQFQPNLTINDERIPQVGTNESFTYLGKHFDFEMKNESIKSALQSKLSDMLKITTDLEVGAQLKLKILKYYIPSQLSFILKIYDIPYTWISNNLDAMILKQVSIWLELPVNSCVEEILELSTQKGGHGIPLLKTLAEQLRLSLRCSLKNSKDEDITTIWKMSTNKNKNLDAYAIQQQSKQSALDSLTAHNSEKIDKHISSLKIQGKSFTEIQKYVHQKAILKWNSFLETVPDHLFKFARKALQQQLPTASNLFRWKKTTSPSCPLCGLVQTNKHVLSNCGSPASLSRYTKRHDHVLGILIDWFKSHLKDKCELYADIDEASVKPITDLFFPSRPDIAIKYSSRIDILELTVCHETNISSSQKYKQSKYQSLHNHLIVKDNETSVNIFTLEITTLGFMSDFELFQVRNLKDKLSENHKTQIFKSVLSDSFNIYCKRNSIN